MARAYFKFKEIDKQIWVSTLLKIIRFLNKLEKMSPAKALNKVQILKAPITTKRLRGE